ncbi:cytochrome P450 20A1-like [Mizuhopecten yessoensis]|uniref:Cytochrome P450 20A1 n=1 Tax=Mizuhopecten yessoensis TaxID=6573 RepID=A0A210PW99_MIZYE|nr:cytochrome P450 20A1-like [Mizuhopecten yessoensis]OWF40771.1 Cytochrome P450 20A1 [Mizuhopecten yessoensis]
MLEFAIFAVTFLVSLLGLLIYLYPGSAKPSTIPGLEPTTQEDGNVSDINRAGSLHEFLLDLHKQFGSIVSFWIGKEYVVSIASPELFKEHQGVFDRPPSLFKMFEPLIGPKSIQFANKSDGRARRHLYDTAFSHDNTKRYYQTYQDVSDELAKKWSSLVKEEHVPLSVHMFAYSLKIALLTMFGESFANDKDILEFRRCYDVMWAEMERRLTENEPEKDSPRAKAFEEALKKSSSLTSRVVKHRRDNPPIQGQELIIDLVIKYSDGDDELLNSDAITYIVGGFHTTGNLLTWAFYFLASHPEVQEKAFREIKKELGNKEVDHTNIDDLPYIRQIVDETLRCAVVAPFAARFQDFESELGGHKIPKNTPVIHALGVSLKDEKYWPLPNKFDPDRFSPENVKTRPPLSFQPFGFAGKRVCPGYRFAYAEATVCLVTLLRKFKVKLVDDQVVNPVHGLVTHPEEEIWIKLEKR